MKHRCRDASGFESCDSLRQVCNLERLSATHCNVGVLQCCQLFAQPIHRVAQVVQRIGGRTSFVGIRLNQRRPIGPRRVIRSSYLASLIEIGPVRTAARPARRPPSLRDSLAIAPCGRAIS